MTVYHSPKSSANQHETHFTEIKVDKFRELRVSSCKNLNLPQARSSKKLVVPEHNRKTLKHLNGLPLSRITSIKEDLTDKKQKIKEKIKSRISEYFRLKVDKKPKNTESTNSYHYNAADTKKHNIESEYRKYLDDLYRSSVSEQRKTVTRVTQQSISPTHNTVKPAEEKDRKKIQTFFRVPNEQSEKEVQPNKHYEKFSNIMRPVLIPRKMVLNLKGLLIQKYLDKDQHRRHTNSRTQKVKVSHCSSKRLIDEKDRGCASPPYQGMGSPTHNRIVLQEQTEGIQPWGAQDDNDILQKQYS